MLYLPVQFSSLPAILIFFFFLSLYLNVVLTSAELCSLFDFPWISICTTEQKTSGEHCLTQNFPILCAFS